MLTANLSLTVDELYRKNGLHVVEYDYIDGDEDAMIYRMLDDEELDSFRKLQNNKRAVNCFNKTINHA
jgi:hypothetical protein